MKKITVIALVLASLTLLFSCGAKKEEVKALVYGTTEKVSDMDPASAYDFHTWEIFQNISEGLMTYKPGSTELVPGLAESYTMNDKGDEYTFILRKDLKFSNGDVLDANAVKWTIDRVIALKGDPSWLVSQFVDSVTVKDATTVVIKLKAPTSYFPALTATPTYFPLDPKVFPVNKIVKDPTELVGGALVASGPYKVNSFKRDQEVILDANESYFGDKAQIGRIIIRYYADATTLRLALDKGEVDLAFKTINPSDIVDLQKKTDVTTFKMPGAFIRYVSFEASQSVFKKKELRQAFALLLNRQEIIDKVYLGQNMPLYSMIPNGMIYQDPTFKTLENDVAKAEDILKKAGYSAAKPLEFDLWYTTSHYGDTEVNQAEVMKAQLERSKLVKVNIKSAEWATYKEQWAKKLMPAYLTGWYPDYVDPDDYSAAFAQTEASKGMGIFFSDKKWDDLFTKEQTSADPKVREQAFKDVQALWPVDVPCIPLWQGELYVFTKPNIKGVNIGPTLIFNYNQLAFTK